MPFSPSRGLLYTAPPEDTDRTETPTADAPADD